MSNELEPDPRIIRPDIVRVVAEAMEDAAMRWLGTDLGTIHRDDIAREALDAIKFLLHPDSFESDASGTEGQG